MKGIIKKVKHIAHGSENVYCPKTMRPFYGFISCLPHRVNILTVFLTSDLGTVIFAWAMFILPGQSIHCPHLLKLAVSGKNFWKIINERLSTNIFKLMLNYNSY